MTESLQNNQGANKAEPKGRMVRSQADLTSETAVGIAEAAADLFAEKGYVATSIREICKNAGITKPTLYYYYGSKDNLISYIVNSTVDAFLSCIYSVSEECSLKEGLLQVLLEHFSFAKRRPATVSLLSRLDVNPPPAEIVGNLMTIKLKSHQGIRSLFERAVKRKEIVQVDVDFCTLSFLGLLIFHTSARMRNPELFAGSYQDAAEKIVNFVMAGLKGALLEEGTCFSNIEGLVKK